MRLYIEMNFVFYLFTLQLNDHTSTGYTVFINRIACQDFFIIIWLRFGYSWSTIKCETYQYNLLATLVFLHPRLVRDDLAVYKVRYVPNTATCGAYKMYYRVYTIGGNQ